MRDRTAFGIYLAAFIAVDLSSADKTGYREVILPLAYICSATNLATPRWLEMSLATLRVEGRDDILELSAVWYCAIHVDSPWRSFRTSSTVSQMASGNLIIVRSLMGPEAFVDLGSLMGVVTHG